MNRVKASIDYAVANVLRLGELAEPFCKEAEELQNDPAYQGSNLGIAIVVAQYADHVTAELQAENAALRAKVAELEAGREWLPIDENTPYEKQILTKWVGDEKYPPVILINTRNSCIGIGRKDGFWHSKPNQTPTLWCHLPQGVAK